MSSVYEPTPHTGFPSDRGAPTERDARARTFLTYLPGSPVKKLPPGPHGAPLE
jgi:hypothetical protein